MGVVAVRRFGPEPSPARQEAMARVTLYSTRVRRVTATPKPLVPKQGR